MIDSARLSRRTALGTIGALLATPAARAGLFQNPHRTVETVEKATEALVEITSNPNQGLPLSLLRQAKGVVIIPDLIKAGFVVAGRFGRGVLLTRDETGGWTNPVFLGMGGGSIGAQIGASATDVILVFRTERSVRDFLHGDKITLGVDASAAAGPVGVQAEAATDLKMRADILSYSRSRGLFAGVSIEGASLHIRHRDHDIYYGVPNLLVSDIQVGRDSDDNPLPIPRSAAELRALLTNLTTPPPPPGTPIGKSDREIKRSTRRR